jgi:hypothetical protein
MEQSVMTNEQVAIPIGLGFNRRTLSRFAGIMTLAIGFAGLQLAAYGNDAFLIAVVPMVWFYAVFIRRFLAFLIETRIASGMKFRFRYGKMPFTALVSRKSFRAPLLNKPPRQTSTLRFEWFHPDDVVPYEARLRRRRWVAAVIVTVLVVHVPAIAWATQKPDAILLLIPLGGSALVFARLASDTIRSVRREANLTPAETAWERVKMHAASQIERGRGSELTGQDIEALVAIGDGAAREMTGALLAYKALLQQRDLRTAVRYLRRAVQIADIERRKSGQLDEATLSTIYQEAAFVAAAYANDLDYAMRAMAVGLIPGDEPETFYKALCAIWIRVGDRARAEQTYSVADGFINYKKREGESGRQRAQLDDLKAVFATGNVALLESDAVHADLFTGANRPHFSVITNARPIHLFNTLIEGFWQPIAPVVVSAVVAFLLYSDGRFTSTSAELLVPVMLFMVLTLMLGAARGKMTDQMVEISSDGVLLRTGQYRFWTGWDQVDVKQKEESTTVGLPALRSNALGGPRMRLRKQDLPPLHLWKASWPPYSPEEAIRRCAPQFRPSAETSPGGITPAFDRGLSS